MGVATFRTRLIRREKVGEDAWEFYFEKPSNFEYEAGQYIKLYLDIKNPDSRGKTRYFTLSSSPTERYLVITTRILKSTFKLKLGNLKPGATVKMRGPWGDFVLDKKEKQKVFLAGGIGLTPFRSILKYNSDKKRKVSIAMINSYSDKKQAALSSVLEEFKKLPGFTLEIIIGRITTDLLHKYLDERGKYVYYISGPEKMVTSLALKLKKQGVKEESIKIDDFPGYEK